MGPPIAKVKSQTLSILSTKRRPWALSASEWLSDCQPWIEEHDLPEGVLGVPGDAERGLVAVDARPVVFLVVLQVVRVTRLSH